MTGPRVTSPNAQGWLIVTVCFLALSASFSARSILGLTMPSWEQELGWSRGFVSTGGALALVVMALVAPVAGNLADRFGPRRLLAFGLLITGLGMGLTATADSRWQFLLFFSVFAGVGFGIVAIHVVSTVVALTFSENRGLATGAATAGSTAGQLLVIPLLAVILTAFGWRQSYLALAVLTLALIAAVWLLIRPAGGGAGVRRRPEPALSLRLGALARSPVFQALFWSFVICGFTTAGVIETHLLPYAAACGYPPLEGAAAYGVLSAFNMVGMVGAGWLTDRMHRPLLLGSIYIVRGLCFVLLMFIIRDISLLFLFAVMFGLFDYSTVPPTASLVASHIGLKVMGLAMGILSAGHSLGAAVGAFLGGWLFDLFAQYEWVWLSSIALAIVAGLLVFTIRESRTPEPVPAAA